jgi:hypothetical protein
MSQTDSDQTPATPSPAKKKLSFGGISTQEWILLSLMALAVVGVGYTQFSPANSLRYWLLMVPVYGTACLILEWSRLRGEGRNLWSVVGDQALHWLGVLIAVCLVYLVLTVGKLDDVNAGLMVVLVLALGTFLAGIHLGKRLFLVGAFLGAELLVAAYLAAYMWALILAGVLMIGGYVYWRARSAPPAPAEEETGS